MSITATFISIFYFHFHVWIILFYSFCCMFIFLLHVYKHGVYFCGHCPGIWRPRRVAVQYLLSICCHNNEDQLQWWIRDWLGLFSYRSPHQIDYFSFTISSSLIDWGIILPYYCNYPRFTKKKIPKIIAPIYLKFLLAQSSWKTVQIVIRILWSNFSFIDLWFYLLKRLAVQTYLDYGMMWWIISDRHHPRWLLEDFKMLK